VKTLNEVLGKKKKVKCVFCGGTGLTYPLPTEEDYQDCWEVGDKVWIEESYHENSYPGVIEIATKQMKCAGTAPECRETIKKGQKYAKCIDIFEKKRVEWMDTCLNCGRVTPHRDYQDSSYWKKWEKFRKKNENLL